VIHQMVATTPEWYWNAFKKIGPSVRSEGVKSLSYLEPFPSLDGFDGMVNNEHSGGHYTPEFNKYWAESMFRKLKSSGVFD